MSENDCEHDWRIVSIGKKPDLWIAKCRECNDFDAPDVVNEQTELLRAMNDSAHEMLDCYAKQIEELTAEIERLKAEFNSAVSVVMAQVSADRAGIALIEAMNAENARLKAESDGWQQQVKVAKNDLLPRLRAAEVEIAARDARKCETCLMHNYCATEFKINSRQLADAGKRDLHMPGCSEWEASHD